MLDGFKLVKLIKAYHYHQSHFQVWSKGYCANEHLISLLHVSVGIHSWTKYSEPSHLSPSLSLSLSLSIPFSLPIYLSISIYLYSVMSTYVRIKLEKIDDARSSIDIHYKLAEMFISRTKMTFFLLLLCTNHI